jgi:hypothetical protein
LPQKLDFDLRIIKEKTRPFEELLAVISEDKRLKIVPDEFVGRTVSHPLFGLMRWYFKSKGAACFTTGLGLQKNMGKKYQLEHDHIFPTAMLKKHGYSRDNRIKYQMAQEVTNRALLTAKANRKKSADAAAVYLKAVKEISPGVLGKQCVPEDESLWHIDRFEDFLSARRELLAQELNEFLDNLAAENAADFGELSVVDLIQQGESEDLEFKQSLRWGSNNKKEILKTIAGFANADGGTLLIGVKDDQEVIGLEQDYESLNGDKDEFELHLGDLIDAAIGKVFRATNVTIKFAEIQECEICRVDVKPSRKAIVLTDTDKHGRKLEKYYLRSGNSTKELSMSEASEYIESSYE